MNMPLLGDDRGELRGVDDGEVRGVLELCFFFCGEGVLLATVSGVDLLINLAAAAPARAQQREARQRPLPHPAGSPA